MPPKRKRITTSSDLEEQPSAKRLKSATLSSTTGFQSLTDDCLSEILGHLPPPSFCVASFTSKRFNTAFEAFKSRDLTKKFGLSIKAINNLPPSITAALYPRGQYLAFEELVHIQAMNDDINLEKQLSKLNNWTVRKISEKINKTKLEGLDEGILKIFCGKVVYTDLAPDDTFALWSDTDSNTSAGKLNVTFFLFGNKDHFVEVTCNVFSYYEHSGGTFTCDLTLNAKLKDGSSPKKCTDVNGLLEGYKEQAVPEDPAKWVRFKFDSGICREDLDKLSDDDRFSHTISTSSVEGKMNEFVFEAWTVSKDEVKLIKNELGLKSFTDKEIIELLAMIAYHPLKGLSLTKD